MDTDVDHTKKKPYRLLLAKKLQCDHLVFAYCRIIIIYIDLTNWTRCNKSLAYRLLLPTHSPLDHELVALNQPFISCILKKDYLSVASLRTVEAGPLTTCTPDQFACQNGDCINGTLKCDGVKNCVDGTDEIFNTCYNTTCAENFFRCNYGGCVPHHLTCNGGNDCWDKSDENVFLCADEGKMDKLLAELKGSCRWDLGSD